MIIVIGIVALSLVVFAHELGHFVAAKISGIEVERFSIGIGKRLAGFKIGKTDYCVSLLPLGGFCKMKGEDSFAKALGKGDDYIAAEPGSFYAAHPLKRIFVAIMGPFFNFVFSVLVLSILWIAGFTIRDSDNRILLSSSYPGAGGGPIAQGKLNPADEAGLMDGDRLLSVDGVKPPHYSDIRREIAKSGGRALKLEIERSGSTMELVVVPARDAKGRGWKVGIFDFVEPIAASVRPDGPAARAGLVEGDRIVAVDGIPLRSREDLASSFAARPSSAELTIRRADAERKMTIFPDYDGSGNPSLGITLPEVEYRSEEVGFAGGFRRGFEETVGILGAILESLGGIFRKFDVRESVGGVARIIYFTGDTAVSGFSSGFRSGIESLFRFLAGISVSLLVTNLLPIPVLDGGLIVIFLIETIRRKPLKARTLYRITLAGFAVVGAIFLFSTFSDILFFSSTPK